MNSKMNVKIIIGVPKDIIPTEEDIQELKNNIMAEYLGKFAPIGVDANDIEISVVATDGEFYTKIVGESSVNPSIEPTSTKTLFEKEPIDIKKTLNKDNEPKEEVDSFDNYDITEDQEKACSDDDDINMACESGEECCDYGCEEAYRRELTKAEENIALLKLYLMLSSNDCWQELITPFGETHLDYEEKEFLLNKLFVTTGLDSIAKKFKDLLESLN